MIRILIDTNVLMAIADLKIDIFTELQKACDFIYEPFVLGGSIQELEKIMREERLRFHRAAKLALALLRLKKVAIIPSEGQVDDVLVEYSKQGDLILTQDLQLKKRLQHPYLTIRQRKRIILVR